MPGDISAVITCEHAGNRVPPEFTSLFRGRAAVLKTHRAWDPGALPVARSLARLTGAPFFFHNTTRLIADTNRSPDSPERFSEFTSGLPDARKEMILKKYYLPYRRRVERAIAREVSGAARVLHVSIHSFTPVLNGETRDADIGLLFDPARKMEKRICTEMKSRLETALPGLRIKFNYPYRGTDDGFTTYLRKLHPPRAYAGIEIELNQAMFGAGNTSYGKEAALAIAACIHSWKIRFQN